METKRVGHMVWRFVVQLNPDKDGDLIDYLQVQPNKADAVRRALRLLMAKEEQGE